MGKQGRLWTRDTSEEEDFPVISAEIRAVVVLGLGILRNRELRGT